MRSSALVGCIRGNGVAMHSPRDGVGVVGVQLDCSRVLFPFVLPESKASEEGGREWKLKRADTCVYVRHDTFLVCILFRTRTRSSL